MARLDATSAGGIGVLAFLDMLAWSEIGPKLLAVTDDGYDVLVGSTWNDPHRFDSYNDHPQQFVKLPKLGITSSAAGRYQFLARTWDALAADLKLTSFAPWNQDRGAIELIRERNALGDIQTGRIEHAIERCSPIWASLPGAGYGQHENKMAGLLGAYHEAVKRYA
jgi:muramidase (phage lysozyme)